MNKVFAFLVGGGVGAVVGGLVGFFGLYAVCWIISFLAGNENYMHLMWLSIPLVPTLALVGLVVGAFSAAARAGE